MMSSCLQKTIKNKTKKRNTGIPIEITILRIQNFRERKKEKDFFLITKIYHFKANLRNPMNCLVFAKHAKEYSCN